MPRPKNKIPGAVDAVKRARAYRRRRRPVDVTYYGRTLITIDDPIRRIMWRCREIEVAFFVVCREHGINSSLVYTEIKAGHLARARFEAIDEALDMAAVNGWRRPFPRLPAMRSRRRLADVIDQKLFGNVASAREGEEGQGRHR